MRAELDLIWLAGDGDSRAFAELARRYRPLLRWSARRFYAPGLEASDLDQEALLALLAAARTFNPVGTVPFVGFLKMVLTRRLASAVIAAKRQHHRPLNEATSFDTPTAHDDGLELYEMLPGPEREDPHRRAVAREELAAVLARLDELSALERRALGHWLGGDSYEAIAAAVSGGVKTVDNAIQRVRRKLAA